MNDVVIKDPETGITFTYKWRDSYGWGVSFCDKAYEFFDGVIDYQKHMERLE